MVFRLAVYTILSVSFLFGFSCDDSKGARGGELSNLESISDEVNRALENGDLDTAIELIEPYTESGDPEAQFSLGVIIRERGQKDLDLAIEWFRKAAHQGHDRAAGALSGMHRHGWSGMARSQRLADCWDSVSKGDEEPETCREIRLER